MATWLTHIWQRVRESLWFVPVLMSVCAVLLALVCARMDQAVVGSRDDWRFLYHGDAESARTLLSTIAGSMITVAGVAFSVTMVALSLASTQLGPRLLNNFMRDPGNQVVLGGFIATFLFCLLALGSTPQQDGELLSVSASIALLLAVASLLLLIYFIHHIATSMQADYVIQAVAREVDRYLQTLFPAESASWPTESDKVLIGPDAAVVTCPRTGYLQGINESELLKVAEQHDLQFHLLHRPGDFLAAGIPIMRFAGANMLDEPLERRIQRSFFIGGNRTSEQDPEYGLRQLVEIAVRALSPGVNDPFTAMTCIDHLAGLLASIAATPERPPLQWDGQGHPRIRHDPIDFSGLLEAAFNQIRQNAAGTASVSIRLLEALRLVADSTQDPERLATIEAQGRMIREANEEPLFGMDRSAFEKRYEELRLTIGRRGTDVSIATNDR